MAVIGVRARFQPQPTVGPELPLGAKAVRRLHFPEAAPRREWDPETEPDQLFHRFMFRCFPRSTPGAPRGATPARHPVADRATPRAAASPLPPTAPATLRDAARHTPSCPRWRWPARDRLPSAALSPWLAAGGGGMGGNGSAAAVPEVPAAAEEDSAWGPTAVVRAKAAASAPPAALARLWEVTAVKLAAAPPLVPEVPLAVAAVAAVAAFLTAVEGASMVAFPTAALAAVGAAGGSPAGVGGFGGGGAQEGRLAASAAAAAVKAASAALERPASAAAAGAVAGVLPGMAAVEWGQAGAAFIRQNTALNLVEPGFHWKRIKPTVAPQPGSAGSGQGIGQGLFLGGNLTITLSAGNTVTLGGSDFLGGGANTQAQGSVRQSWPRHSHTRRLQFIHRRYND